MNKTLAGIAATVLGGVLVFWLTEGVRDWVAQPQPARPPVPAPRGPQAVTPPPAPTRAPATTPAPSPARNPIGFVVVDASGPVRALEDLGAGEKLCGSRTTIESLRSSSSLAKYRFVVMMPGELSQAMSAGLCAGALVREHEHARQLFPAGVTHIREIPVYE